MTAFLDPLAIIRQYESNNRYSVGVDGTDLSSAALGPDGFPQWSGSGNSHAAGAYQFQPATWAIYAPRLAITDFSKKSQDAVAAACYSARGFADWAPYDTPLSNAIKAAGGAAAFSLGVSWLAMAANGAVPVPTPPRPPPPPPSPDPSAQTIIVTATDSIGRKGTATIPLVAMMLAGLVAVGVAGASRLRPYPPPTELAESLAALYAAPPADGSIDNMGIIHLDRHDVDRAPVAISSRALMEMWWLGEHPEGSTVCGPRNKDLRWLLEPSPCVSSASGR